MFSPNKEIKVMAHSPNGVSVVKTSQRLAQLILFPKVQTRNQVKGGKRGEAGFGSYDAYWLQAMVHSNQNSLCL